ncbi:hypothetical protein [Flavobacterium cerinum]|uniref:Chromosome partition protein Smc n=1 Tax=Flavobacterium cerinum TaxID=2502784 RepID=A0ABY5ISL9_9FLAO|nr:hypothetical protein [Flavobacterium cerinum]UUC45142.1 hypothetical protein NOX80_16145 [Flavobacterium cerinum]
MGLFDNKELINKTKSLEKSYEKLVNNQNLLNNRISQLKSDLEESNKRSPEYEKVAKEASKKTSEYRNRANETLETVKTTLQDTKALHSEIEKIRSDIESKSNSIQTTFNKFNEDNNEVISYIYELKEKIDSIDSTINLFEETIRNHPDFETEIIELETSVNKIKENESKSLQLIRIINNRKIELDTLYNEILGYEDKDEYGDIYQVNGLKKELEDSLDGLEERTNSFKKQFTELETSTIKNTSNLLKVNSEKIAQQIKDWEEKYFNLNKKIESLLPNAVTAGLSHAFSKKKEDEVISYGKHKEQFGYGITGMISVSIIPFIISLVTLFSEDSLDVIINRAPKLVIAILPLYIPVLWLSISSSKKMNLSKRLIEEYAHKEVLSKTFEGLSGQIHNLEEDNISKELKLKLLQDFLQMYSENPGKLISDYNKSDHPIMELLENSNKLDKTIVKVQKIPGLNKLAEIIEKKTEKKLEQVSNAIERTLDKKIGVTETEDNNDEEYKTKELV